MCLHSIYCNKVLAKKKAQNATRIYSALYKVLNTFVKVTVFTHSLDKLILTSTCKMKDLEISENAEY